MKEIICIICPKSCRLLVDEEKGCAVTGHGCARGAAYGPKEAVAPTRVVTSTVKITGAALPRCPVRTSGDIPKDKIGEAMRLLNGVTLRSPVRVGDVALRNVCGSGKDFIVTRSM